MNQEKLYFVWAQQALGYGSEKLRSVIDVFSSVRDFYQASDNEIIHSGIFTKRQIENIKKTSLEKAENILLNCEKLGIDIVTFLDEDYPKVLREIYNPPVVLYTKGKKLALNNNLAICVVGSRNATDYGCDVTFDFAYQLAKNGITIISGGARGIDTIALKAALKAGNTDVICVCATGLDVCYPKENEDLYKLLQENGSMVSEFPPGIKALPRYFPIRNRIMSGMSNGILVVEASLKSGAIITTSLALEQGRDVFAVPGSIRSEYSAGTNLLIKDGAIPATEVSDILQVYGVNSNGQENDEESLLNNKKSFENVLDKKQTLKDSKNTLKELPENISENAKRLYNELTETPKDISELAENLEMNIISAQTAAMELLILGTIKDNAGLGYSK